MRTLVHIASEDTDQLAAMSEVLNKESCYTLLTVEVKGNFTYFKINHAYSWEIYDLGVLVCLTKNINRIDENL